eukprot:16703_1
MTIANEIRICDTPKFRVTINSFFVEEIVLSPYNPRDIAVKLLSFMNNWYAYKTVQFDALLSFELQIDKIVQLLSFLDDIKDLNKNTLDAIYTLLWEIFGNYTDFDFFFEWIYYYRYTLWISINRLDLINEIGRGMQSIVFTVKDNQNDDLFALKIFHNYQKESALQEERILLRIEKEIYGNQQNNLTQRLYVPRIITKYNISCNQSNAILMELIDTVDCDYMLYFKSSASKRIRPQLSETIQRLAIIGIGHFDIKIDNILLDTNGNFWLCDFGLGFSIDEYWNINDIIYPVIGTWDFYSPFALQLNIATRQLISQNVNTIPSNWRPIFIEWIKKANLYSLEALILYYIDVLANGNHYRCIQSIANYCHQLWSNGNKTDIDHTLQNTLHKLWMARSLLVENLLYHKKLKPSASVLVYNGELFLT